MNDPSCLDRVSLLFGFTLCLGAAAHAMPQAGNANPQEGESAVVRQWAATARASSEYGPTDYGAVQLVGAPNVPALADDRRSWTPKAADGGEEWIELTFAEAVFAAELRVVQNFHPGTVVRIEVLDAAGAATIVWSGPDRTEYEGGKVGILAAKLAASAGPISRVKLHLDTKSVPGWNEIDAVELVGTRSAPVAAPAKPTNPAKPEEREVANTTLAQWAAKARASSEYQTPRYGAGAATGAPDVPTHGDNASAWAMANPDGSDEWIELLYARPVHATGVRVVQSFNPGAVARIDVIDRNGKTTTVWRGPDTTPYESGKIGVLEAKFEPTTEPIAQVFLHLDAKRVSGWNEIDAVALLGTPAAKPEPGHGADAGGTFAEAAAPARGNKLAGPAGITLLFVEAQTFQMGYPPDHERYGKTVPRHSVKITRGYWLGETEVTQKQWHEVMGTKPWQGKAQVVEGNDRPATCISYDDAKRFCEKLNALALNGTSLRIGYAFRLPTEAEWELACRAGTTSAFSFGDGTKDFEKHVVAMLTGADAAPRPVKSTPPNPWGFYEMHGNVMERCLDLAAWRDGKRLENKTYHDDAVDPVDVGSYPNNVVRGGDFSSQSRHCESSARAVTNLSYAGPQAGLRVVYGPRVKGN